jgi:hypothetical protein
MVTTGDPRAAFISFHLTAANPYRRAPSQPQSPRRPHLASRHLKLLLRLPVPPRALPIRQPGNKNQHRRSTGAARSRRRPLPHRAPLHGRKVGPEDRRYPRASAGLPPHHPQGPIRALSTLTRGLSYSHFVALVLRFPYLMFLRVALQILREIEGDLAGFKCGLAHFFRMLTHITYLLSCVSRHFHVGSFLLTCRHVVSCC